MNEPAPAVDAATVLLLRDGDGGLEVFLQRRGAGAAFMAGAYVFPGGTVDDTDREMSDELVDDPQVDLRAFRVAAIREAFEEAGVLLGKRRERPIDDAWLGSDRTVARRRRLHDRADDFDWRPWLAEEGIVLAATSLAFTARWVTPVVEPRRFDTWFFRAMAPPGQHPDHDDVEMTDSLWARPRDALDAAARGDVFMVPPTRRNLEALASFDSATAAVEEAREDGSADPIQPVVEQRDDGSVWVTHETFPPIRVR